MRNPIHAVKGHGFWWFRIFGWGISAIDRTLYAAPLSERHGIVRTLRVGRWSIKGLRPPIV